MTEDKYKSCRVIDKKPRWVIVDENGKIINRNPGKDKLKTLDDEIYSYKHYTDEEFLQ